MILPRLRTEAQNQPAKTGIFYDRQARVWTIQLLTADDCQIGDADFCHQKRHAVARAEKLAAAHGVAYDRNYRP